MSAAETAPQPAVVDEASVIMVIATGFAIILGLPGWLGRPDVSWQRFIFTNIWMLGGVLLWSRRYPLRPISWHPGPTHRLVLITIFALAAVALTGTITSSGGRMPLGVNTAFDYVAFTTAGPAAEEFFYRGLCFNFLLRRLGSPAISTALVSVFFVTMHFPTRTEAIALAIISVVLCITALRTRSLLVPLVLHSGWNLCVLAWSAPPSISRHAVVLIVAMSLLGFTFSSARPLALSKPERL
ncbi:MAG: CPBP family intramembrane metalloprotease [Elusimicrobia bacterium]|nr:CPBP family intramembrane metalloprotease [Elusimicrobiota bacterium]